MTIMPNSFHSYSKEPLTEKELQKFRRLMNFIEDNEVDIKRFSMISKGWWLVVIGIAIAAAGTLSELVEILKSGVKIP